MRSLGVLVLCGLGLLMVSSSAFATASVGYTKSGDAISGFTYEYTIDYTSGSDILWDFYLEGLALDAQPTDSPDNWTSAFAPGVVEWTSDSPDDFNVKPGEKLSGFKLYSKSDVGDVSYSILGFTGESYTGTTGGPSSGGSSVPELPPAMLLSVVPMVGFGLRKILGK